MTEKDLKVGDLVELDPSKTTLGKGMICQIEKITDQYDIILTTIVWHNNSSLIGRKMHLYKSGLRLASAKSKFLRRPHLCDSA